MSLRRVLVCSTLVSFALAAPSAPAATSTGWDAVQGLAPHTHVQVRTDKGKADCHVQGVTEDKLTCDEASFPHSEIKSIRRINKTKSTFAGLALGAGIGAGVGAGVGSAINSGDTGSFLHVSGGKSAGVGAAFGVIIGAAVGAIVGHGTNAFATTIYKR